MPASRPPALRRLALAAALGVLAAAPAPTARAQSALAPRIDAVLDRPGLAEGFWGVVVADARTGEVLYRRNATRRFVPASNAKLYSGFGVLDALGPDARFTTRLYVTAPVDAEGVVRGDLVVRGGGDPSLGSQPNPDVPVDKFAVLREWVAALRRQGVTRIAGNVVGDDDVFDDVPYGPGWAWDDMPFYYSAQISGLVFGDGCVDVGVVPTAPGQPARLTMPEAAEGFLALVNRSRTAAAGAGVREGYERVMGANRYVVTTRLGADAREKECLAVENPTRYAAHALRFVLREQGIAVDGEALDADERADGTAAPVDYSALTLLHEHASAPLAALVHDMEKESLNHYAEMFVKQLGRLGDGPAPTEAAPLGSTARGLAVLRQRLAAHGVGSAQRSLGLVDGSGLSRMNVVTPAQTVALLRHAYRDAAPAVREAYLAALPVGGVDGTLKNRLGAVRGRVRGKTGTLGGASSLSGYVTTASGRTLAFSLMANHYDGPGSLARRAQDDVLAVLARL